MDHSLVVVRYAKAYFSLSKEKNQLLVAKNDIALISSVCTESEDFRLLLESPVINPSLKNNLFSKVFKGKITDSTLNFLKLITENRREFYIPDICRNFLELVRKHQGIKTAVITFASETDFALLGQIKTILEKELSSQIEISGKTNPSIIGGLIIRVDDKQLDGSISTQLKKIRNIFLETEIK
jgi:F-type H+-transporting ATPase subunit delta